MLIKVLVHTMSTFYALTLGLIAVALELLVLVSIFEQGAALARLLKQGCASLEQLLHKKI